MKPFHQILCIILCSCFFLQCKKDHLPGTTTKQDAPLILNPITADVQGTVQDEKNQPAAGVKVIAGDKTAVTDANGYFRISGAALDKNASLLSVEKDGYFKAFREFSATSGINQQFIKLVRKSLVGTIAASSGGNITLSDGAKISLPAGSVVVASSNAAYTGTINVYAFHNDNQSVDPQMVIAGSSVAKQDGKLAVASSFGLITVELESATGDKLQLKSGIMATILIPIPSSNLAIAPATLSLSHLDESTGIWEADGTATREGNNYTGKVPHFSNWNYNQTYNGASLTFTLTDSDGSPLTGVLTYIRTTTSGVAIASITNAMGQATAVVPANDALVLSVMDECGGVIYKKNISALANDSDLGSIKINGNSSILTFKGKLQDCDGLPVKNGLAHFVINGFMYRVAQADANGNFTYTWVNCSGAATTVNVFGTDETSLQKSASMDVNITSQLTDFGSISVCGSSAEQFIKYKLDGVDYNLLHNTAQNDSLTSSNTQINGAGQTYISGGNSANSARVFFSVDNLSAAGTYGVSRFGINAYSNVQLIQPFNVTFTNVATSPGQFYEGSLSGDFKVDGDATTHSINLTFKVIR